MLATAPAAFALHPAAAPRTPLAPFQDVGDGDLKLWRRTLATELRDWLDALPADVLPDHRFHALLPDVPAHLHAILDECGLAGQVQAEALVQDVALLAALFAHRLDLRSVDVRLERVTDNACWRFHRDCVRLRLITTYRGPGTDWVPGCHAAEALRLQREYRGPMMRLARFDVGLFKGCLSGSEDGILHRSPPISGSGTARLLLVVNEPTAYSPPLEAPRRPR